MNNLKDAFRLCAWIGLAFAVAFPATLQAQGISISPSRIFFSGTPGEQLQQTLTFTNTSDKEYTFSTKVQDWHRDSLGNKVFYEPGSLEQSNANWLDIPEEFIQVGPNQSREVLVEMRVPEDASSSKMTNAMLFFTQMIPQEDDYQVEENHMGIRVLFEFGIHAYYTPPGNSHKDMTFTNIEDFGLQQGAQQGMRKIGVKVKNSGEVSLDAKVEFELTNTENGEELLLDPVQIALMPEEEQWTFFFVPGEVNGNYLGVAFLQLGSSSESRVGEKEFSF